VSKILIPQQPQQHIIRRVILGVKLKSCTLEPLDLVLLAVRQCLGHQTRQRHTKQCQTLGLADGFFTIDLQAIGTPCLEDGATDRMPGLGKHPAAAGVAALGKGEPVTTLLAEPISTQSTE
jgi:hypothetical protein